jgi:ATP-dependent exoDNAse (exonuclease V) alpha subunit
MITKNIDQNKGIVNGRRGTVIEILRNVGESAISAVTIELEPINSINNEEKIISITWMETARYDFEDLTRIYMFQIPLRLCYAVTAHKSQGQTIDRVAICIKRKPFSHGAFYVALSRVRRLQNLILFSDEDYPTNGPSFAVNEHIVTLTESFKKDDDVFFD